MASCKANPPRRLSSDRTLFPAALRQPRSSSISFSSTFLTSSCIRSEHTQLIAKRVGVPRLILGCALEHLEQAAERRVQKRLLIRRTRQLITCGGGSRSREEEDN